MEKTIQDLLNPFWADSIVDLKWEMANHRLIFKIERTENDINENHEIIFEGVYGLCYFEEEKFGVTCSPKIGPQKSRVC
ncbi:MAG: hypothetical protein IPP74_06375 [Alphaproteobacteria bacterium]|nr:hypothetical protein [Alphaproteobacteria bacterium]